MSEYSTTIVAPAGGVFTDDVGVITGEVELRTTCGGDGTVTLRVRYAGADEWYGVRGGAVTLHDPADAQVLHDTLVAVLDRPEERPGG